MYHLSDDNLDKLFGSLKDLEREPDAALWSDISSQLPGKGFFNWGTSHFNVYYAAVGLVGLLLIGAVAVNSGSKQTGQRRSLVKVRKIQQSIVDTTPIESIEPLSPAKKQQRVVVKEEELLVPMPVEMKKDSVAPVEVKKVDSIPVQIKPKKIVKIIRRDTVRVQDTIKVKRRRK